MTDSLQPYNPATRNRRVAALFNKARQTDTFRSGSSFLDSEFSVRSGAAALIRSLQK